jgi:hypothetical protein
VTYRATFAGKDASGLYGLWVTDGTSAGTTELTFPIDPNNALTAQQVAFPKWPQRRAREEIGA